MSSGQYCAAHYIVQGLLHILSFWSRQYIYRLSFGDFRYTPTFPVQNINPIATNGLYIFVYLFQFARGRPAVTW